MFRSIPVHDVMFVHLKIINKIKGTGINVQEWERGQFTTMFYVQIR